MGDLLGGFEQAVMLAILRLGPDAYGRTILHEVGKSLNRKVSAGAVYTTLDRLEKRGLLGSQLAEGPPVRGGRLRRYHTIESEGIDALNEARRTLNEMWRGIRWPVEVER